MDNFYEQVETTGRSPLYAVFYGCMIFFSLLAMFLLLTLNLIPAIISALLAAVFFFQKKRADVEYEYEFTNGEIEVDLIYEKKSRKKLLSLDIKDIEILAEESSYHIKDLTNSPNKTLSLYPKKSDKRVYVAMFKGEKENLKLRFTPDEKFLNLCFKYNPRAVKKY